MRSRRIVGGSWNDLTWISLFSWFYGMLENGICSKIPVEAAETSRNMIRFDKLDITWMKYGKLDITWMGLLPFSLTFMCLLFICLVTIYIYVLGRGEY